MKVPLSWLKEYVDFEDSIDGLADKLTFSGAEVEGIEIIGGDYEEIVVGEVVATESHPNADRLTVCRVSDGTEEFQVVCGAPNVTKGGKYPFARTGTTLPGNFKIKRAKLRGVESVGMLCAEDELGISDDHEGLMSLDPDVAAGTPLSEIMGPPEVVFDLEITPNRPDCLSIIGIAREVAAIYGAKLKRPDVNFDEADCLVEKSITVSVEDSDTCPRYTARTLDGVVIKPAPDWMQKRLSLVGIRPINNVVDITNYVLLESGHPLHAFDQTLLAGDQIVVRHARKGETITTLDGEKRELDEDMLLIADAEKPIAIAGIMGGRDSEIQEETVKVLLESAYFDPPNVRKTSKKLALTSESSYRFARGVDCGGVEWASRRAASLMAQHADAKIAGVVIDVYPQPQPRKEIVYSAKSISSLLGVDLTNNDLEKIFTSLELQILKSRPDFCTVAIPSFRPDLEREVDLAEECARIYGIDNIPESNPQAFIVPDASDPADKAKSVCRANMVGLGMREIMNYSLVSIELLDIFDKTNDTVRVKLPHPISEDQSILRTSLIPQLVESLGRNHTRQIKNASFFEIGRVFHLNPKGVISEEDRISIGIMGPRGRTGLDRFKPTNADEMFIWIKGVVTSLLRAQKIDNPEFVAEEYPSLSSSHSARIIIDGSNAGRIGIIKSSISGNWRIKEPIAVAELQLNAITARLFEQCAYEPISTQPAIERDMAVVADNNVRHAEILSVIKAFAPDILEKVELFDIFTGKGIPENCKSMAYTLTYRDQTRTLTDKQANKYHNKIKNALREQLGVDIRE